MDYRSMSIDELRALVRSKGELTVEVAHELHRRLWDWLYVNAEKLPHKRDWPGWDDEDSPGVFGGVDTGYTCFLCAVHFCRTCPMRILNARLPECVSSPYCGPYFKWCDAYDADDACEAQYYARCIRDCVLTKEDD